mgnify:CR=1 FL=1
MTYVEMTELFKTLSLDYNPPRRDGMYWVYYLDEPFCGVEKHRKMNRSVVFFPHFPGGNYNIKEVTTEDFSNRISGFILKIKQKKLDESLKRVNSDF